MTLPVRIAEMTWYAFRDRIAEDPIVLLPTGSTEQHGPHLPLATDTLLPEAVAVEVARALGGLVAPSIPYGYKSQPKSGGGNHFPGTLSLDGSTLVAVVRDVLNELARHGAKKLVVKLGYWEFIDAETEAALFPNGLVSWALEHAAVMETSVMLHLHPDLVRGDAIPDHPPAAFPLYDVYPFDTRPIPPDGVLSSAAGASAEKGAIVLAQVVPAIATALREAFAQP